MHEPRIVAVDIETIPDPDAGRAAGLLGDDRTVVEQMARRSLEATQGATRYPPLPEHRIVSACATVLDPSTGEVEMRCLGGETEASTIHSFLERRGHSRNHRGDPYDRSFIYGSATTERGPQPGLLPIV